MKFKNRSVMARWVATLAIALLSIPIWMSPVHAQTDPFNGTWILKVDRSRFPSERATPRSQTLVFEGTGATKTGTAQTVDSQGRASTFVVKHIYDGQSHPAAGSPSFDALTYTRISLSTIIYNRLKAGNLVGIGSLIASPDGKTITVTGTGVDEGGGDYLYLYEKLN